MVYRIYEDKIALLDEQELALAEIDFPAFPGEENTVEITHTYVDDSLRGQGIAGRLMAKLAEELKRRGLKAVPSCSYAQSWFEKHPEESGLLF